MMIKSLSKSNMLRVLPGINGNSIILFGEKRICAIEYLHCDVLLNLCKN